jgi:hypothetical protein
LRLRTTLLLGLPCGLLSAATAFLPIGDFPGISLFHHCIGLVLEGRCQGLPAGFYLGPGLVFGLAYALALQRGWARAGFLVASVLCNTLAVMIAVNLVEFLDHYLPNAGWLSQASSGLIAGAVGGGLLARVAAISLPGLRWGRLLGIGAGLGLLLPIGLADDLGAVGLYIFYALWQGGYGAALAWSCSRATRSTVSRQARPL